MGEGGTNRKVNRNRAGRTKEGKQVEIRRKAGWDKKESRLG